MPEKTKLEEMSAELPEKERKELLAKINKNKAEDGEDVIQVELKREERERLIAEEMLQIGLWPRFILWLQTIFSGKSKRDLFLNLKLKSLKHIIKQLNPGISGFETRNLTPKFARQLFDLYSTVFPLLEFFQIFSRNQEFQEKALTYLVEAKYEDAKHNIEDLIGIDKLEEIFSDSGYENEVKKQVLRRFNEYTRKIPDKIFTHIEEGLKPLFYLKNLVLYHFAGLFRHFNYFLGDSLDEKYPYFDHAPVMLMLDQLERLYYVVYLPLKLGQDWFCHTEYLHYYWLYKKEIEEADELDDHEIDQEVMEQTGDISNLVSAVLSFSKKVPMLELIRYFRKDPYYRLIFNIPRVRTKTTYVNALRNCILEQLDERMASVKMNVVNKKIREVFKTDQLLDLFYYNEKPNFDYEKLGLPYFTYTRSLVVIYNYLSKIYKGYIQEIVQITNAYILSNNRLIQNRLMQYAAGLEELEAKIVLLDRSLSPDEDDGKTLTRYRQRLTTDLTQQKMYRGFILQKDKEARDLIDRGEECLLGIKKIFDEIISSPMESIKSVLKTLHFHRGKNQTLINLIRATSEIIANFHELLEQLILLEKGS